MAFYTVTIVSNAAVSTQSRVIGQTYTQERNYLDVTKLTFHGHDDRVNAEFYISPKHTFSVVKEL